MNSNNFISTDSVSLNDEGISSYSFISKVMANIIEFLNNKIIMIRNYFNRYEKDVQMNHELTNIINKANIDLCNYHKHLLLMYIVVVTSVAYVLSLAAVSPLSCSPYVFLIVQCFNLLLSYELVDLIYATKLRLTFWQVENEGVENFSNNYLKSNNHLEDSNSSN